MRTMRFWVVQKQSTVEAIFDAIQAGQCTTENQVEAIAAQCGDCVTWASSWASGEEE